MLNPKRKLAQIVNVFVIDITIETLAFHIDQNKDGHRNHSYK